MMQGDEAFLHLGPSPHFLGAAEQHPHRTVADLFEQGLFLGVRLRLADAGDLFPRDTAIERFLDDFSDWEVD